MCGAFASLGSAWELAAPAALAADLLDRAHPVFEVKGGCKFAVLHGEKVDRHDPEALSRGLGAIKVANRRAGSFAAHAYFVVDGHDLFDCPAKIGNDKADALENVGEFVARKRVLIAGIGPVIGITRLRQKRGDVFLRRPVQRFVKRRDDPALPRDSCSCVRPSLTMQNSASMRCPQSMATYAPINMLFPLALSAAGTSSCMTSQCSAIFPLPTRKISTAIIGFGPHPV
jgi:hypothetical protein